jgi:hypothetical protein
MTGSQEIYATAIKVIPHGQSYICRLVKGASAKVDMARLEPTLLRV